MTEIVLSVLFFFFEAMSLVFCLHYLYGEKPRLNWRTMAFVIVDGNSVTACTM